MFIQKTVWGSSAKAMNYQSTILMRSFMARDASSLSNNAKKEGRMHPVSI